MKITKRWSLLPVFSAILAALVLPSLASATQLQFSEGRQLVPVASPLSISGKNVSLATNTFGTTRCEGWNASDVVTKNDGTSVEASSTSAGVGKGCASGSRTVQIEELAFNNFVAVLAGKGTVTVSFTQKQGPEWTCHWSGSLSFVYSRDGSSITFNEAALRASLPACGTAKLSGSFVVERTGGRQTSFTW
jgi:hypothetical protein